MKIYTLDYYSYKYRKIVVLFPYGWSPVAKIEDVFNEFY